MAGHAFLSTILLLPILSYCAFRMLFKYLDYRTDKTFGEQHGCQPPNRLLNEFPLGLDRLHQIFSADANNRLMALFMYHFRLWGDTLEQVFLGTRALGTIDPRNLEAMLSTQFNDFGYGPRSKIFGPLLGDGIFTQDHREWKHSRKLLSPQFGKNYYRDLDFFGEHVDNLCSQIPKDGNSIDLQPLFFKFTLDTTTALLFGTSVYSLREDRSESVREFEKAFDIAQQYLVKRYRLLDLYWLIGGREFWQACDTVHKFVDRIADQGLEALDKADQQKPDRYLFLSALAQDPHLNRTAIRDQLLNILLAGRDTTACLLSWTMYVTQPPPSDMNYPQHFVPGLRTKYQASFEDVLLRLCTRRSLVGHPMVMSRLREEIQSNFEGSEHMKREDLMKMPYLKNVLKESLRLYSPVPVNTRVALRTTTLPTGGGPNRDAPVLVRRGEAVAYSVYSLHRQVHLYGRDSEDFRPERWDDKDLPLKKNKTDEAWGFLPFNGGPRVCLGQDFALIEASYMIVRLVQKYPTIKMTEYQAYQKPGSESQKMTLVMSVGDGCVLHLSEEQS